VAEIRKIQKLKISPIGLLGAHLNVKKNACILDFLWQNDIFVSI